MQPDHAVQIRKARAHEYGTVARLHRSVRAACLPYLPDLHTPDENLAFFRDRVFGEDRVWVAVRDEALIGFCAFRRGWLDHLYVLPAHHGRGAGTALLQRAKAENAELQLWVFQRNVQARRFYEANGFALVETTDGAHNEEREPDARYRWVR
jgi:GNAT superfamily N-acetyltransferase